MKVLVTGGSGLVGTGIKSFLIKQPNHYDYVFLTSNECNLLDYQQVLSTFEQHKPQYVIHLAAKVGGLYDNMQHNVEFWDQNVTMNNNVLRACLQCNVKKVISCLSTCIFPDKTTYPITESMIDNGPPHTSNPGYSYAKRMLKVTSELYANQYSMQCVNVIPTNIFGPGDNFDIDAGHVIPSLIHKCYTAKKNDQPFIVKGSGKPLRQFLYNEDLARIIIWLCDHCNESKSIIVCPDDEMTIEEVASRIKDHIKFEGPLQFDNNFSDGQFKKTASNAVLKAMQPDLSFTPFEVALKNTCDWFVENYNVARKGVVEKKFAALITGVSGQDGSYLAELLVEKGYEVHGIIRRQSSIHLPNLTNVRHKIHLHYGDVQDKTGMFDILQKLKRFDRIEVYNLAAMSHVKVSFEIPEYTALADGIGVLNVLECIRESGFMHKIRFYQASTSEMFGKVLEVPQSETTPFRPQSPYGCAKVYAHWITRNYRESYDMFACSGILFNHESERRGPTFVTQKICNSVKQISRGEIETMHIGNIHAMRDWGYAKDYVRAMWLMLQHECATDYVVSTGEMHSVKEFIDLAFAQKKIIISWNGDSGYDQDGIVRVVVDSKFFRPSEVDELCGNCDKIKNDLKWRPTVTFEKLVQTMMAE